MRKVEEGCSDSLDAEKAGPITVLLADDHPMVRQGLSAIINQENDIRVVTQAASGREAIEHYVEHHPNIALLDLGMPVIDGIGVLNAICEQDPACRVVIISSYDNEEEIYRALLAGAKGYILKGAQCEKSSNACGQSARMAHG